MTTAEQKYIAAAFSTTRQYSLAYLDKLAKAAKESKVAATLGRSAQEIKQWNDLMASEG